MLIIDIHLYTRPTLIFIHGVTTMLHGPFIGILGSLKQTNMACSHPYDHRTILS